MVGLSILKRTLEEAKLCTLLINEEYRKRGYASLLLEDSFAFLETEKPIITIPENRLEEFAKIIETYGWTPSESTDEYYSPEIIFNKNAQLIKK